MKEIDFMPDGPISWDTFIQMPHEKQEAMLQYAVSRFHIGTAMIAQDLFHISRDTLYRYIQSNHIDFKSGPGGRVPEVLLRQWKKWAETVTASDYTTSGRAEHFASHTDISESTSADKSAASIGDVVRTMHDLYGRIKVTITIEPT